eukprot:188833-Amphidinium_carterae.1
MLIRTSPGLQRACGQWTTFTDLCSRKRVASVASDSMACGGKRLTTNSPGVGTGKSKVRRRKAQCSGSSRRKCGLRAVSCVWAAPLGVEPCDAGARRAAACGIGVDAAAADGGLCGCRMVRKGMVDAGVGAVVLGTGGASTAGGVGVDAPRVTLVDVGCGVDDERCKIDTGTATEGGAFDVAARGVGWTGGAL